MTFQSASQIPCIFLAMTPIFCPVINGDIDTAVSCFNLYPERLSNWCQQWLVPVNETETAGMLFSRKRFPTKLRSLGLGQSDVTVVTQHKHFGRILKVNMVSTC